MCNSKIRNVTNKSRVQLNTNFACLIFFFCENNINIFFFFLSTKTKTVCHFEKYKSIRKWKEYYSSYLSIVLPNIDNLLVGNPVWILNKVFKDVEMVCEKLRVENCTKYNLFCINYFLQELWYVWVTWAPETNEFSPHLYFVWLYAWNSK